MIPSDSVSKEQTDPQAHGLFGTGGGDFYRYQVTFQGATDDQSTCLAPEPVIEINCPATLRMMVVEQFLTAECVQESNTVTCFGNGMVTVDCYSTSIQQDVLILGPLVVRMPSPGPFFCDAAMNVGQAFFISSLCPDGTQDHSDRALCVPSDTSIDVSGIRTCFRICSGECSEQNLAPMSREAIGTCRWEGDQTAAPMPATQPPVIPPTAPEEIPTESPVAPPTQIPVSLPTEQPASPPSTASPQVPPTEPPTSPPPSPCVNVTVGFSLRMQMTCSFKVVITWTTNGWHLV